MAVNEDSLNPADRILQSVYKFNNKLTEGSKPKAGFNNGKNTHRFLYAWSLSLYPSLYYFNCN